MGDNHIDKFYDDILCKDLKILTEVLGSLSSSYRLLVGAAEEFNRITLAHRHDAEEAIDRASELGEIIDDIEEELENLVKLYLRELMCKIEIQQLYNDKLSLSKSTKLIPSEFIKDQENKYETKSEQE